MADSHDPDDPELEKIKEDTAQIFVQFVRLHSHSNQAVIDHVCHYSSTSPTETPSRPSSAQVQVETSRSTAAGSSTLPRQKSTDTATRKDPHPKAVYSTRHPAQLQIVSNPPCSGVEASCTSTGSNPKSRPDKLSLTHAHKRVPSATGSDHSSGKTTPAQDPPMELMSPGGELSSSYPPPSTAQSDRGSLFRSAEHTTVGAASRASCTASSREEKDRRLSSADKGGDPNAVKARMIADRLKIIGDEVENEQLRSRVEELAIALGDAVLSNSTMQTMQLMFTQSNLSWRKVAELFKLLCRVMETRTRYDDQFSLFEKAWYCLLDSVVPWIQYRGGWAALQRETEPHHQANTPNVPRRSCPLNPAQSEPVLLLDHSPTTTTSHPLCQPPYINGVSTLGRVSEARQMMTYTPQMSRHNYHHRPPPSREQSSPCLPRDRSNSQHSQHSQAESTSGQSQGRSRIFSLTESGNFKREEDGMEDNVCSISELNMTVTDDETFVTSQEGLEEEEEGESQQEAEKTLTSSGFHASASFSSSAKSSPIIVPSPHSGSQPETISIDEFPIDSGIDASPLSLSGSPRGVSFIVGGQSSSVPRPTQTSWTSLSSAASASPVHTSPTSRKNSSNGGYFSDKTRPRSGGSLKESRQKQSSGDSPQCYRTGSLRSSRSHPRYHSQVTTPTNGSPSASQLTASGGHSSSWMQTPVRRMSTSAAVIYELVKDFFRSP